MTEKSDVRQLRDRNYLVLAIGALIVVALVAGLASVVTSRQARPTHSDTPTDPAASTSLAWEDKPLIQHLTEVFQQAGSAQLLHLNSSRQKDSGGWGVSADFLMDNGTVVTYSNFSAPKLASGDYVVLPNTRNPDEADLTRFARHQEKLVDTPCSGDWRGELHMLGQHLVETATCLDDERRKQKWIDGQDQTAIAPSDFDSAAQKIVLDATLVEAHSFHHASISLEADSVITTLTVSAPLARRVASDVPEEDVMLQLRRSTQLPSDDPFTWGFSSVSNARAMVPVSALDPDILHKIWEAEGSPVKDWGLLLHNDSDDPYWITDSTERHCYDLQGQALQCH